MKKKAFLPILGFLTVPVIVAIIVLLAVLFLGSSLLIWVLQANMFRLIGGTIIILVMVTFFAGKPLPTNLVMPLIAIGVVLILLPFVVDAMQLSIGTAFNISP